MWLWSRRVLVITIIFATLLAGVNLVTYWNQKEQQDLFAQELLRQAELVSTQITNAIDDINQQGLTKCDQHSIDQLRFETNSYEHVYDLGLVIDGKIACTANWGVLTRPLALPAAKYITPSGYEIYSRLDNILPINERFDVAKLHNVVGLTVLQPFKQFTDRKPNFTFDIKTKAQNHIYLQYQPEPPPLFFNLPWLSRTQLCSSHFSYCVNIRSDRVGLGYYAPNTVWHVLALCFIASLLIKYSLRSFIDKRQSMEFRFRRAISHRKLYMEYQPVLDLNGRLLGVESLIRWHDERYGFVSPELFLNIAEELKLYPKVSRFTVETSIREMAPLLNQNPQFSLALNVNTFEIRDIEFLHHLHAMVSEQNVNPAQIKIEITERIAVPLSALSQFSERAKTFGFHIALDDFGTGVANLVWLTEIDFDVIKIDRVFTQALSNDFKKNMVFAILDLLSGLNKQVIFEGVETEQQLAVIAQSCPTAYVQGWYFYKALTKRDLYLLFTNGVVGVSAAGTSTS